MSLSESPSAPDPRATMSLPARPELSHLKNQAKHRLTALRRIDPHAKLSTAQFAVARDYGFASWRALKAYVEALKTKPTADAEASTPEALRQAVEAALQRGDADALASLLDRDPALLSLTGGQWDQPLLNRAAYAGHLAIVELLLRRGADPNQRDTGDNACALHFAAEMGHLAIVERLVETGADIHGEGDLHELGVLGWATCFAQVRHDVARYLMDRGARLHVFSAIALGQGDAVRRMIEADPSRLDARMSRFEHHRRPLHHAARCGRPEMVALLLELGADATQADDAGSTPMTYAAGASSHARQMIELLAAAGGRLDLVGALGGERYDMAEAMLHEDPGRIGEDGQDTVALHVMAAGGLSEPVRWLIDHGVALDARRDQWGSEYTALHVCAEHGRFEIARMLMEAGADPDVRDSMYNGTALNWADHFKRDDLAELLIAYGAKRDADPVPEPSGVAEPPPPISDELRQRWRQAFEPFGRLDAVTALLAEHPELVDEHPWPGYDFTPLQATAGRCVGHRPDEHTIAKHLIAHGARHDLPLVARAGVLERVEALLAEDPTRLDRPDAKGCTALYRAACVYGDFPQGTRVVELLLQRGAAVDLYSASALGMVERVEALLAEDPSLADRPDPEGCPALHWAVRPRTRWLESQGLPRDAYERIVRRLLAAGASVDAPNEQEQQMQPLHHVGEWPGSEAMARLLLDHGADINATSGNGWTPLDYALDRGRKGIAHTLEGLGGRASGRR